MHVHICSLFIENCRNILYKLIINHFKSNEEIYKHACISIITDLIYIIFSVITEAVIMSYAHVKL